MNSSGSVILPLTFPGDKIDFPCGEAREAFRLIHCEREGE